MTDQSNSAAERSAHVHRGDAPSPADWPVVRMPDGTWKLKSVVALENRIAELEATLIKVDRAAYQTGFKAGQKSQSARISELKAALRNLDDMIVDLDAGHMELQQVSRFINAALAGGKDE